MHCVLCAKHRNHRILDLRAFRRLVERGLIPPEEFITIETGKQEVVTRHFKNSVNVRAFYEGKTQYKVRRVVANFWCSSSENAELLL